MIFKLIEPYFIEKTICTESFKSNSPVSIGVVGEGAIDLIISYPMSEDQRNEGDTPSTIEITDPNSTELKEAYSFAFEKASKTDF